MPKAPSLSEPEAELLGHIRYVNLPEPKVQCPIPWHGTGRRFRADFVWVEEKLIVEVQGGTYIGGHHTRGKGHEDDCTKMALAVCRGWRYLIVTSKQVSDGDAVHWIGAALGAWDVTVGLAA